MSVFLILDEEVEIQLFLCHYFSHIRHFFLRLSIESRTFSFQRRKKAGLRTEATTCYEMGVWNILFGLAPSSPNIGIFCTFNAFNGNEICSCIKGNISFMTFRPIKREKGITQTYFECRNITTATQGLSAPIEAPVLSVKIVRQDKVILTFDFRFALQFQLIKSLLQSFLLGRLETFRYECVLFLLC